MKNLKYIIILLITISSIIVSCKRKSNDMIRFSGHVMDNYDGVGIEGADVYLIAFNAQYKKDTVAKVKTGRNGIFDIAVTKKGNEDTYGIYSAKDEYFLQNPSDIYYPDKNEYNGLNLYLSPFAYVQLHFQCLSNDKIIGAFQADYFGDSYENFDFKNNTDTTLEVRVRPYLKTNWQIPITMKRNGFHYFDTTYYISFTAQPHVTNKLDMLIN